MSQTSCILYPARILFPVPGILSLLSIAFLICLCYSVPIASANQPEESQAYIIKSGDQLLISVVGLEKEPTILAVVRPDGMIAYPAVGDVEAAGLTIAQLSHAISRRLSTLKFYTDPQVTIQLQGSRQEVIYIFGDVNDPGQKQFQRAANVIAALAAAGGFKETADLANAKIIKKQKKIIPVDLTILLGESGIIGDNLLRDELTLEDGDVLMVPSTIELKKVSIIGYVNNPGQYPAKSRLTPIEALALAGGPMEPDADVKHIKVIKLDGKESIIDATKPPTDVGNGQKKFYIQPGDSVVVPEKGTINIFGEVTNPGQHGIDGEIGILGALALAGTAEDSNLGKLKIVRCTGERLEVDAKEIWKGPCPEAEIRLTPGDTLIVPTVFKIDWNLVNTAILVLSWVYTIIQN